jgi:hypothetical protein
MTAVNLSPTGNRNAKIYRGGISAVIAEFADTLKRYFVKRRGHSLLQRKVNRNDRIAQRRRSRAIDLSVLAHQRRD